MDLSYTLVFTVFPYLCLTTFVVGHAYRYVTDRYRWNARSSEFLEKKSALSRIGPVFHWGIVFTFLGHAGGSADSTTVSWTAFGIDSHVHLDDRILEWPGGRALPLLIGAIAACC